MISHASFGKKKESKRPSNNLRTFPSELNAQGESSYTYGSTSVMSGFVHQGCVLGRGLRQTCELDQFDRSATQIIHLCVAVHRKEIPSFDLIRVVVGV